MNPMTILNRRRTLAALLAGAFTTAAPSARAQVTEQRVGNDLQVTSTGNVNVDQAASGSQEVGVLIDGNLVTQDGIYRTQTGQVVLNNGQITATGNVNVRQSASGNQSVQVQGMYSGMPAQTCDPGAVRANADTGQLFYQGFDCCWYEACAQGCQKQCRTC